MDCSHVAPSTPYDGSQSETHTEAECIGGNGAFPCLLIIFRFLMGPLVRPGPAGGVFWHEFQFLPLFSKKAGSNFYAQGGSFPHAILRLQ